MFFSDGQKSAPCNKYAFRLGELPYNGAGLFVILLVRPLFKLCMRRRSVDWSDGLLAVRPLVPLLLLLQSAASPANARTRTHASVRPS